MEKPIQSFDIEAIFQLPNIGAIYLAGLFLIYITVKTQSEGVQYTSFIHIKSESTRQAVGHFLVRPFQSAAYMFALHQSSQGYIFKIRATHET